MDADSSTSPIQNRVAVALILLLALAIRLIAIASLPRGLESDEASNVWNAWCILHTGHDERGERFPIIAERAFDDYRTTSYIYALIPFQLIGGMNEFTSRLPGLLGNVVTAGLVFYIARKLFGRPVAIPAAVLFAVMPWNILVGRLAHEATLMPLGFAATLALLIRAGLPITDHPARPNWRIGILAGVSLGISMYGYAALRIALPATLISISLFNAAAFNRFTRKGQALHLVMAASLPAIVLVGPLCIQHLQNAALNVRAHENSVWEQASTFEGHLTLLASRYAWHFGPEFLFARSTPNPIVAGPEGYASLQWYWLPLLIAGIAFTLFRRSPSTRTLLAITLCFPLVDLFFGMTEQAHPFYSSLGMLALPMLAAVGWIALLGVAGSNRRAVGATGIAIAAFSVAIFMTRLVHDDRSPRVSFAKNTDLSEAADEGRLKLDSVDEIYFTQEHFVYPYAPLLVAMNYDPRRWFDEPRKYEFARPPFQAHQTCVQFGKIHLFDDIREVHLDRLKPGTRVLLVLRPDQTAIAAGHEPVKVINVSPASTLLIYEFSI